ncbi:hypothetical protein [Proteocatella sphenisci]|uniref:hypothetical protein n=1 Tax=Proteocatella sphenisci TaxID=181070 RepID=UPI0004907318|nr:hypothetical protein [Proteocatella sphenisci]
MKRQKPLSNTSFSGKNGYTIIEVLISLMLASFIITISFNLFSELSHRSNISIMKKELIESADYLEQVIKREFSRSEEITDYLDIEGNQHSIIGSEPVQFLCISFKRTRYTLYDSGYVEEFLIDGKYKNSVRKPVYISKQTKLNFSSQNYKNLPSFEVGNHISKMMISRIDGNLYRMWLDLEYENTGIGYSKDFIVELQDHKIE